MNSSDGARRLTTIGLLVGLLMGFGVVIIALTHDRSAPTERIRAAAPNVVIGDASTTSTTVGPMKMAPAPKGFVAVSDDSGAVVGYTKRSDMEPGPGNPDPTPDGIFDVWDWSGETLQGHLWPNGYGYRTLEQEKAAGISRQHPPDLPPVSVPKVYGLGG